ncbi:MAG: hypothetical protein CMJ83_15820 [Planctomycetes bacterium]|nr:hypothetical protein [Planctomycetota bacterium]
MRHPFQRKSNKKDTVQTPFQRSLVGFIDGYSKDGQRMSGRKLSQLLGKSANHISQMLNDGFIPSGPAILEMAEVLRLGQDDTDELIRGAMQTKASQRSRDNFWINETNRMLEAMEARHEAYEAFLKKEGLEERFDSYARRRRKKK